MVAGVQAKITDFGMSKLATVNPRMTSLTLCPGNVLYMSPEALDEPPTYTDKLDIFSFGVLLIQIVTREFPSPGSRFQVLEVPHFPDGVRAVVPEKTRRQAHLNLLSDAHPLKPLALQCLKSKTEERPLALELSEKLCDLKRASKPSQHQEDVQPQEADREVERVDHNAQGDISIEKHPLDKHIALQKLKEKLHHEKKISASKRKEALQLQAHNDELRHVIQDLQAHLQETIVTKDRQLLQKESIISELQHALMMQKKSVEQINHSSPCSSPDQVSVTDDILCVAGENTKLKWRSGQNGPQPFHRGAAVAYQNLFIAYFNAAGTHKVFSYQILSEEEEWSALPQSPYRDFGLVIVHGLLTTVGGTASDNSKTSSLFSLTETDGDDMQWSTVFPQMLKACSHTAALCTENVLVVAGGFDEDGKRIDTVQLMQISNRQWSLADNLPQPLASLSGALCGDQLYLAGGFTNYSQPFKSVITSSIGDLLPPKSFGASLRHSLSLEKKVKVWKEVSSLPVARTTLTCLGSHLLALGGQHSPGQSTASVYEYDLSTDSWHAISTMSKERSQCLSATLPNGQLIVVGGFDKVGSNMLSLEIAQL
jgi:serine/threonine protein kinase